MLNFNVPITVVRLSDAGQVELDLMAIDTGDMFLLPVDADIETDDRVQQQLPNGKLRSVRITKVDVLQSPFPGGAQLDHTEAHYATASAARGHTGDTFHVNATNVQLATGDGSHQTLIVSNTTEHVLNLAAALEAMMPILQLEPAQFASASGLVIQLREAALETDTNPSKLKSLVKSVREIAVNAAGGAAGSALVALADQVASNL